MATPASASMLTSLRSGLAIALDTARALVPAPALPPDLSFSFLNPAKFPAYPSPELRRYVAWLLREAEVPAFLWGPEITRIYGSKNKFRYHLWAVKDEEMEKAVQVLDKAGFPPCQNGLRCTVFDPQYTKLPSPDHHYHTDHNYEQDSVTSGVYLYRKSRLFPSLPDPPLHDLEPNDRYYMLNSDERFPHWNIGASERSSEQKYPVIVPTPARYLEAICLLAVRYMEGQHSSIFWNAEKYRMMNLLGDRFVDVLQLSDLDEPWYEYCRRNVDRSHSNRVDDWRGRKYQVMIYADLKEKGHLQPPETKEILQSRGLNPATAEARGLFPDALLT
ncbi:uncharacterized protein BO87DRAFT_455923 [Aspergillus neoniger CBS 115656]|uniref:Uncharacterized protein n=1 Tax=Aspergillus neoniger (strain CBS 115656) TaxID=1448310 RepID=A0A318ZRQ1_ASPNB|nr:hypothetical protein BO87DRAFT_455923 [Aspergillus neoniger CBS 115656]PYH38392.1 hypothetical protein BO87DRAFT_455923 [Aspergillus neoniger CBS 115656]